MLCIKGFLVNVENHKGTGFYVDKDLEFVACGFNVDGVDYC